MKFEKKELDSVIKNCSNKLELNEFNELCRIIWVLLNGATFGIKDTWSTDFLKDCENIWLHNNNTKKLSIKAHTNVIDFTKEKAKKLKKELDALQRNDPDLFPDDFESDDEF